MTLQSYIKRIFPHQLLLLGCLFFLPFGMASAQDSLAVASQPSAIALRAYVESSKVPLNQKVTFHLELSWSGDMSCYQITSFPQPVLTNLLMEGSGSTNRIEPQADGSLHSAKMITYTFRPVEMGIANIHGVGISYRDTATGLLETLQSHRVMIEIVDPVPEGGAGVPAVLYMVLLGLFLGTVLYFMAVYLKKRRTAGKNLPIAAVPAQVCLDRLAEEIEPHASNLGDSALQLQKILQHYLSDMLPAFDKSHTAAEVCGALLAAEVPAGEVQQLRPALEELDLVRFAGQRPDPATFSDIRNAVEGFLQKRKQYEEVHLDYPREK